MKTIHELARVDAEKAASVSLLADSGLVGGNCELGQCLRREHTVRTGTGRKETIRMEEMPSTPAASESNI